LAKDIPDKPSSAKARTPFIWRLLRGTLVALLTAAVGCGAIWGFDALRQQVRLSPGYQVSSESLRLVKGPSWMTPAILAELDVASLDPEFPREFSLLDEGISARIAAAYERSLWVDRVERIVKHDPRVDPQNPPLEVFLKFRRPIAFVQVQDGFALVDDQGVRLPGLYREPRLGAARFLVITGVPWLTPRPGQGWDDPSLQAGVQVACAVEPKREAFRLASIDVSNFGYRRDRRDTEIALYTVSETRIKWGKAPSSEAELLQEKTLVEKVAYLDYVYQTMHGRVDGVLAYIDVQNEVILRRSTDLATRVRS